VLPRFSLGDVLKRAPDAGDFSRFDLGRPAGPHPPPLFLLVPDRQPPPAEPQLSIEGHFLLNGTLDHPLNDRLVFGMVKRDRLLCGRLVALREAVDLPHLPGPEDLPGRHLVLPRADVGELLGPPEQIVLALQPLAGVELVPNNHPFHEGDGRQPPDRGQRLGGTDGAERRPRRAGQKPTPQKPPDGPHGRGPDGYGKRKNAVEEHKSHVVAPGEPVERGHRAVPRHENIACAPCPHRKPAPDRT